MEFKNCKIIVYVPSAHAGKIRNVLAENGAGKLGKYDNCTFSTKGVGRYRALDGAKPYIGKKGMIEEVAEEKIETICLSENVKKVVLALKKVHPYEEPAIDIIPLLNE
jgi:hypothetical protein